jgi:hypothetical protein
MVEDKSICGTLAARITGTPSTPYLSQKDSMASKVNPFFRRASLRETLIAKILKLNILKMAPKTKPLATDSHPKKSEKDATKSAQMSALFIMAIWNRV